jgi:hypothetical protein
LKCIALACALAVATLVSNARADDKSECVAAYSDAQDLRLAGKLAAAHDKLSVCARSVCPAFIAHDCGEWASEIETSMPSVVFGAKDANGVDVIDVHVSIDGIEIKKSLDAEAVAIDPGPHKLVFTRDGDPPITPITKDVMIRIAEKNRPIVITFAPLTETVIAPPPVAPPAPPPIAPAPSPSISRVTLPPAPASHTQRTVGFIVGAAGIVGILGGATVGIVALSTKSARCGSNDVCETSTLGILDTESTISTTALMAGTAFLAGGVALILLEKKPDRAALWIAPSATGRGLDVVARF